MGLGRNERSDQREAMIVITEPIWLQILATKLHFVLLLGTVDLPWTLQDEDIRALGCNEARMDHKT
jgi:hypothetical protein